MKQAKVIGLISLCLFCLASVQAQPGYSLMESIDSMVANADYVCIATVKGFEEIGVHDQVGPQHFRVKWAVEEKLKSPNPLVAHSPMRVFPIASNTETLAKWKTQASRLLLAADWENEANNLVVELDAEHPSTLTADFQLLRDAGAVLRAARIAVARMPAHVKRIHTFEVTPMTPFECGESRWKNQFSVRQSVSKSRIGQMKLFVPRPIRYCSCWWPIKNDQPMAAPLIASWQSLPNRTDA